MGTYRHVPNRPPARYPYVDFHKHLIECEYIIMEERSIEADISPCMIKGVRRMDMLLRL